MRSLFGNTLGGAAGAISKITGTLGKGLATLTFDKEYQKTRLKNSDSNENRWAKLGTTVECPSGSVHW